MFVSASWPLAFESGKTMKSMITHGIRTRTIVRRHAIAAFSVLSLFCVCTAFAKKERQWQTGTLLGVIETNVAPTSLKTPPNTIRSVPPKDLVNDLYTFDAGKYIYQSVEMRRSKDQPPFTANGPLQFAIEDEHVYLRDDRGKEHDTRLVARRRKAVAE